MKHNDGNILVVLTLILDSGCGGRKCGHGVKLLGSHYSLVGGHRNPIFLISHLTSRSFPSFRISSYTAAAIAHIKIYYSHK